MTSCVAINICLFILYIYEPPKHTFPCQYIFFYTDAFIIIYIIRLSSMFIGWLTLYIKNNEA